MEKLEWKTVKRKVSDIFTLKINPRKITEKKRKELIDSVEKFNLVDIPVINFDDKLISGEQRLKVLILLGRQDEEIDVRFPNRMLTPEEVKEYVLIANTHAGEWDFDILKKEFSEVDTNIIGLDFEINVEDDIDQSLKKEKKKKETKELKPYEKTHILLSFSPDKLIEIQDKLEELKNLEFMEYEQSSN